MKAGQLSGDGLYPYPRTDPQDGTKWPQVWEVRFYDLDGNRQRKRLPTKARAAAWWDSKKKEFDRGLGVSTSAGATPLREFYEEWETVTTLAPSSQSVAKSMWRAHIEDVFGDTPVGLITSARVARWLEDMVDREGDKVKLSTRRQALAMLTRLLKLAFAAGAVASIATKGVPLGSDGVKLNQVTATITPAQVNTIIDAAKKSDKLLITFLARTGVRQSEAFALHVKDLNLGEATPSAWISGSVSTAGGTRVAHPKTSAGVRHVPLDPALARELAKHVEGRAPSAPVFPAPEGGYRTSANFRKRTWLPTIERARKIDATIPDDLVPHELRHLFASTALAAHVPLVTVSKILGHRSVTTTADIYARYVPASGNAAAAAVADAMTATTQPGQNAQPATQLRAVE